jgi:hypothetical protein
MKNILIPTDFSIESLRCIEPLTRKFRNERLNILFVHLFCISDSLLDVLKFSRRNKDYDYIHEEFWTQCNRLEKKHALRITSIRVKYFYGGTMAVFKNLLEANNIDVVVYPENYHFKKLSNKSLDPSQFIEKCGKEVVRIHSHDAEKPYQDLEWLKRVYLRAVN